MHLARHAISPTAPIEVLDARFDADAHIFTTATPAGFAVYRAWPLELLRKREFTGGTLSIVLPCHSSSILFLVGGGPDPLFPPNKVVVWDDARGRAVAELEFRERVRGLAARRGWLIVVLRRRVVAYTVNESIERWQEWDTNDNQRGLVAIASAANSTLLAIVGRQTGHVQLIQLPPCRAPAPVPSSPDSSPSSPRSPVAPSPTRTPLSAPLPHRPARHPVSIIAAHTTQLAALSVLPSGRLLATASTRGTLIRVWDSHSGKLLREFRRGSDKAEIYGVSFSPDEQDICVWSDKGTVHVFSLAIGSGSSNRQSTFSPLVPYISLPRYFGSEWSYAQYRIPTQKQHIALSAGTHGSKLSDAVEDVRITVAWVRVPVIDPVTSSPPLPNSPSKRTHGLNNDSRRSATITKGKNREDKQPSSQFQTRIPSRPRHEYQMIALTYTGGWYRLALPSSTSTPGTTFSGSSAGSTVGIGSATGKTPLTRVGASTTGSGSHGGGRPTHKARSSSGSTIGKGKERAHGTVQNQGKEEKEKKGSECALIEFRRFGRWDGWG